MKLSKLAAAAVALTVAASASLNVASARGIIDASEIQKITTSGVSAYLINTGVSSRAVGGETIPACATNQKSMSLSTGDKANLALLLTAYASGKTVRLIGKGTCDEVSSIESIGFISVE